MVILGLPSKNHTTNWVFSKPEMRVHWEDGFLNMTVTLKLLYRLI
jgi:hypothetical protein